MKKKEEIKDLKKENEACLETIREYQGIIETITRLDKERAEAKRQNLIKDTQIVKLRSRLDRLGQQINSQANLIGEKNREIKDLSHTIHFDDGMDDEPNSKDDRPNPVVEDVISGLQKIADENTDKLGSPGRGWTCRQAIQLIQGKQF